MKYLLDTNVISELQKPNYNKSVRSFVDTFSMERMYVSTITLGELCYGIEKLPASKKKHELSIWLYSTVFKWFYKRIIKFDSEIALTWGKIRAKAGRTLPYFDSLIAATAIANNMCLVTKNVKDFEDIEGINILNPWEFEVT